MSIIEVTPGDILRLKKKHPCGSDRWLVLKTGVDFRIRCLGCERELVIARITLERTIKGPITQSSAGEHQPN